MSANEQMNMELKINEPISLQEFAELRLMESLVGNPEHFKFNEHWTKAKAEEITFARVMSEFDIEHKDALEVINNASKRDDIKRAQIKTIKVQSLIAAEKMAVKNTINKIRNLVEAWKDAEDKK